jgi:hypothetical protein
MGDVFGHLRSKIRSAQYGGDAATSPDAARIAASSVLTKQERERLLDG